MQVKHTFIVELSATPLTYGILCITFSGKYFLRAGNLVEITEEEAKPYLNQHSNHESSD